MFDAKGFFDEFGLNEIENKTKYKNLINKAVDKKEKCWHDNIKNKSIIQKEIGDNVELKCKLCGYNWKDTWNHFKRRQKCPKCYPPISKKNLNTNVEKLKKMLNCEYSEIELKSSGIYMIKNDIKNFVYIGSTKKMLDRWMNHYCNPTHFTKEEIRNKNTKFCILEKISFEDKEKLYRREGAWIRYYKNTKYDCRNKILDPYAEYMIKKGLIVYDKEPIDIINSKERRNIINV